MLDWFEELSRGRGSSGFGPNPLSWTDIETWRRLMNVHLERWEVKLLKTLDLLYLNALHESQKQEQSKAKAKP